LSGYSSKIPTLIEKAVRTWLLSILDGSVELTDLPNWTGLTSQQVVFSYQNAPRPEVPVVVVRQGVTKNVGEPCVVDAIHDIDDLQSDIDRTVDQYKECVLSINVDGFEAYPIADCIEEMCRVPEQVEANAKNGFAITGIIMSARGVENIKGIFMPQAKIDLSVNYRVGLEYEQPALRTVIETFTVEGVE